MKQNPRSSVPFAGLAAALLLTGCTPKIYTSVQRSYPARPEEAPVAVYAETDTLPDGAERLGIVEVKERGAANSFDYGTALTLAMIEANRIGGNGLQLNWQRFPLSQDASHQLGADMVRLPDSLYAEVIGDRAGVLRTDRQMTGLQKRIRSHDRSIHTLSGQVGMSCLLNRVFVNEQLQGNPRIGVGVTAAYRWSFRNGLGFGLRYSAHFSSLRYSTTHYYQYPYLSEELRIAIRLHSIAPEILYRKRLDRWIFHGTAGIGYALYAERRNHLSIGADGWVVYVSGGGEYLLSPFIGIGFDLSVDNSFFGKSSFLGRGLKTEKEHLFTRSNIGLSLNFHLCRPEKAR